MIAALWLARKRTINLNMIDVIVSPSLVAAEMVVEKQLATVLLLLAEKPAGHPSVGGYPIDT